MLTLVRRPPRKIRLRALGAAIGGSLIAVLIAAVPLFQGWDDSIAEAFVSKLEALAFGETALSPLSPLALSALAIFAPVMAALVAGGLIGIRAGLRANKRMARLVDTGRIAAFALPVFFAAPLLTGAAGDDPFLSYVLAIAAMSAALLALAASMAMNVTLIRRRALADEGPVLAGESAPWLRRKILRREARRDYLLRSQRLFGWGVGLSAIAEHVFGIEGAGCALMRAAVSGDALSLSAAALALGIIFVAGTALVLFLHLLMAPGRARRQRDQSLLPRGRRRGDTLRSFGVLSIFGFLTAALYALALYGPALLPALADHSLLVETISTTLTLTLAALAVSGLAATFLALVLALESGFGRMIDALAGSAAAAPPLLLAIVVAALSAGHGFTLLAATAAILFPLMFSIIHRAVLQAGRTGYAEAVRVSGASEGSILMRHVLPNVMPVVAGSLLSFLPAALLLISTLDFAGLGGAGDPPTLGAIIAKATGAGYDGASLGAAAALALLLALAALSTARLSRREGARP